MNSYTGIAYVIGSMVGLMIYYYTLKGAIRNGIVEAHQIMKQSKIGTDNTEEDSPIPGQIELTRSYDAGEISFEEYQARWNELSQE